jgi:hypothetical protein
MKSVPCQQPGDAAYVGDEQPGFGASDSLFPVLGQPTASSEPCEGAFNDPTARDNLKPFGCFRSLDDLHGPGADFVQSSFELGAGITAVSKDMPRPRERMPDGVEQGGSAVSVLNVGAMNGQSNEQASRVGDNMALSSLDLFSGGSNGSINLHSASVASLAYRRPRRSY